jgi:hypothetical protein
MNMQLGISRCRQLKDKLNSRWLRFQRTADTAKSQYNTIKKGVKRRCKKSIEPRPLHGDKRGALSWSTLNPEVRKNRGKGARPRSTKEKLRHTWIRLELTTTYRENNPPKNVTSTSPTNPNHRKEATKVTQKPSTHSPPLNPTFLHPCQQIAPKQEQNRFFFAIRNSNSELIASEIAKTIEREGGKAASETGGQQLPWPRLTAPVKRIKHHRDCDELLDLHSSRRSHTQPNPNYFSKKQREPN